MRSDFANKMEPNKNKKFNVWKKSAVSNEYDEKKYKFYIHLPLIPIFTDDDLCLWICFDHHQIIHIYKSYTDNVRMCDRDDNERCVIR